MVRSHASLERLFLDRVPFGAGKAWAAQGIGAAILGGWQLNALLTAYTGAPFTVTADRSTAECTANAHIAGQMKFEVEIVAMREGWFNMRPMRL